jgi:endonuclease/exonuclease/phosphatase (EEP) superfamily protein YafD
LRGVMAAISTAEEQRAAEISAIIETIDCSQPTILAGDLNSPSPFSAPRQLKELGLIDGFASLHDDADRRPTWHWPGRPLPIALRIDYVFHTPHFVAKEAKTIRRKGSDHSLVVVELKSSSQ